MTDRAAIAPEGAIARPDNPQHMMVLKPIDRRVRVHAGDQLVADTTNALYVIEMFKKVLDPVIYVPRADITSDLDDVDKTTRCPLKGEASYYALNGEEIGWAYNDPFDFAAAIKGCHAFWPQKVRLEIGE